MEMHSDSVCRLCLAIEADNKILSLTPVQELYEKVTNNRLHTNKLPVTACYICYAQLKRCYKFMVKSTIAENTLIEILNTQTEITPKSVCTINRDAIELTNHLTVTPVLHDNFPLNLNVPALVKSELIEQEENIQVEVEEDMSVSDADDCGDDSEEDPLQCIKDDKPGSSNAAIILQSSRDGQVSVPSEVVKTEQRSHKGVPGGTEQFEDKTTAIKRMQSLERIVIEKSEHYLCRFCQTSFNNYKGIFTHLRVHKPSYLRRHTKVHSGERPHASNLCDKRLLTANHLKQHLVTHSVEKLYECDICNSKFTSKVNLIKHIKKHTGERTYECDVCLRKFTDKFSLTVHLRLHTGEKHVIETYHERVESKPIKNREKEEGKPLSIHSPSPAPAYECNICFRKFNSKSNMKNHLLIHDKPHHCSYCDRSFSQSAALVVHTRTHTGKKAYECDICSREFAVKSKLIEHLRTHTGEKPFECKICNRSFGKKSTLVGHVRTHTGEKPFKCNICKRSFSEKSNLVGHVRTHTGEKPFKCNICKRSFSEKSNLVGHVRTHTGEKPFVCQICNRSFGQKCTLVRHVRVHTGEKPFECKICNYSFLNKCHLDRHVRVHTGEKPFECKICNRICDDKTALVRHVRTHTGEKPFECKSCSRSFSLKSNLDTHVRTHTGEKPFECKICNRSFRHKSNLVVHLRMHTDEKRLSK